MELIKIAGAKGENQRYAGVLVLRALAENAPAVVYDRRGAFFETIWLVVNDLTVRGRGSRPAWVRSGRPVEEAGEGGGGYVPCERTFSFSRAAVKSKPQQRRIKPKWSKHAGAPRGGGRGGGRGLRVFASISCLRDTDGLSQRSCSVAREQSGDRVEGMFCVLAPQPVDWLIYSCRVQGASSPVRHDVHSSSSTH